MTTNGDHRSGSAPDVEPALVPGDGEDGAADRTPFDPVRHHQAAAQAPRSVRSLPRIALSAVNLARTASPRLFYLCSGVQLFQAAALLLQVLLGKLVLEAIIEADAAGKNGSVLDVLPPLIGLVLTGALTSVATAFLSHGQRLLGELVQRVTLNRTMAVASAVELETMESPSFFDELQRVQASALMRPLTVSQGLIGTLGGVLGVAGLTAALATIQPALVAVLLLAALPLWLVTKRSGREEFAFNVAQTSGSRLRIYLVETLSGRAEAKELRAFDLGRVLQRRWDESYGRYLADLRRHVRRRMAYAIGGAVTNALLTAAALIVLVSLLVSGRIGLADAGAAVLAIRLLSMRIEQLLSGIGSLFESSLFLVDLERFLARAPREDPAAAVAPLEAFELLAVEHVGFRYPESERIALHDVSMRIRAGEVVALVGENGSGKTTLAKVVAGLFRPTAGRVLWDATDTTTVPSRALRSRISVLFQDFVRYELTARENITFGRSEALDDRDGMIAAAREVGADEFLADLPDGYETLLGKAWQGGTELSVGQWQRVALARAFFRDASLLVLDEPTASLDARSEHELFEKVNAIAAGRAVLLISHRFNSVRSADRIYVLHQGRLVEEGTHDELMQLDGRYAEMFSLQAQAYGPASPTPDARS